MLETYGFYFPGDEEEATRFQEWAETHGVTAVLFCTSGAAPTKEEVAGLPIVPDPPISQRRSEYVFTSASDSQIMAWLRAVSTPAGDPVIVCGERHAPLLSLEIYNDYRE